MKPVQAAAYSEGFEAGKMFVGMQKDDELSRLKAELEEARELLRPFAEGANTAVKVYAPKTLGDETMVGYWPMIFRDLRRARAFLDKAGK